MNGELANRNRESAADELRELGAALRALPVPAADEAAIRRAFRAARAQARVAAAPRAARPFALRASLWASAAAVIVSVATLAWVASSRDAAPPAGEAPHTVSTAEPVVFQPLLYAPRFSPDGAYSIVRVRIPLSALALGQSVEADATIEADVLVGEDGLARGIRFDPEDTLFITASR